jgi:hypothetical protein
MKTAKNTAFLCFWNQLDQNQKMATLVRIGNQWYVLGVSGAGVYVSNCEVKCLHFVAKLIEFWDGECGLYRHLSTRDRR